MSTQTEPQANGQSRDPLIRTDVPPVPDFMGVAGRVQTVADLLEAAQGQLQHFQAIRLVNNDEPTDPISGIPTQDGTDPPTYEERFRDLKAGIEALMADNQDIRDELVAEALKRRKARESAD